MDKVRVGVIGAGFGANVQVPGYQACPDAQVVAVCASRRERAEEVAQRFKVPHALSDYRELCRMKEVDLISVASPTYLHHPMVMEAVAHGKHVLCEKPMALDWRQAREMYQAAERAGVVHMIDHEFRLVPARLKMKELIDQGFLGKLQSVHISLFYGLNADPVKRPWRWISQKDKGGGSLGALGSHYIDAMRWLFGEVSAVCGRTYTFVKSRKLADSEEWRPVDSDDVFSMMLAFENGAEGVFHLSSVTQGGSGERIEAYGSEGSLYIDTEGRLLATKKGERQLTEVPVAKKMIMAWMGADTMLEVFKPQAQRLVDFIKRGQKATPNLYDGMVCQQVMDAVVRSSDSGTWVSLPLKD